MAYLELISTPRNPQTGKCVSRGSLLPLTLFSFIGVQTDRGIRRPPFTLNNATVSLFYIKSANCTMIQMMSGLGFKLMIFYLTLLLIVLFTTLFCIMHSGVNLIVKNVILHFIYRIESHPCSLAVLSNLGHTREDSIS